MRIISRPLSKHTGVEILDIDLKSITNETVMNELNNFFSEYSVVVIRNQNLNPNEFYNSAQIFWKNI